MFSSFPQKLHYSSAQPYKMSVELVTVQQLDDFPQITTLPSSPNNNLNVKTNVQSEGGFPVVSKIFSKKRKLEKFYARQESFVKSTEEDRNLVRDFEENHLRHRHYNYNGAEANSDPTGFDRQIPPLPAPLDEHKERRRDTILAQTSVAVNFCLLIALIVIFVRSTSMAILATAVDCAADLTSGIVIWAAARLIRRRDATKYPRGRTRLEPLAIVIVAVVMAVVNLEVVIQSVEKMMGGDLKIDVDLVSYIIMGATIGLKLILMIVCCVFNSPNAQVLAQDLRNDVLLNAVAIVCAVLGNLYWTYLDPVGAILVCLYITVGWCITGAEQADVISGRVAPPAYINRILAVCVDHHQSILKIDTVHAYHFGMKYLVEVDVVMDPNSTLREVHNVVEPLQIKIEQLPFVERAHLHVDFDTNHHPHSEHKLV